MTSSVLLFINLQFCGVAKYVALSAWAVARDIVIYIAQIVKMVLGRSVMLDFIVREKRMLSIKNRRKAVF